MHSHSTRHRVAILGPAIFLLSGLALIPAGSAWAQPEGPSITGDLTGDNIFGCNFVPGSTIAVTVSQSGSPVWANGSVGADGNGCFNTHSSVDLVPGMSVEATDGSTTKTVDLVLLTIDTIDPSTGVVSGFAPSGATVNLGADTGGSGLSGQTTASYGSWTYNFGAGAITATTNIGVNVQDQDGDSTGANRALFEGALNVETTGDGVSLWHFTPGSTAIISVKSSTGTLLQSASVTTDSEGNAWYNPISKRVPNLQANMHVLATDPPTGAVLDMRLMPGMSFSSFDRTTGAVAGTAPPGDYVHVSVNLAENVDSQVDTVANNAGYWQATLTDGVPFDPMTRPTAWVSVGMLVNEGLTYKIPSLDANLSTDQVTGTDLAEVTPMTVRIYSPTDVTLYTGSVKTDHAGGFVLTRKITRVDLVPGDRVVVTTPTSPAGDRQLTLADIQITDYSGIGTAINIAGTAPAGRWVQAGWYSTNVGDGRWVTPESNDGTWSVELGPGQSPVGLGAMVADADWNFTSTTVNLVTKGKNR